MASGNSTQGGQKKPTTKGKANTTPKKKNTRRAPAGSVDEKTRAKIRKLARTGMSRNAVAREVGVSGQTVSKVCAMARPPITFDRSKIAAATEARTTDLKAMRAEQATASMEMAKTLLGKMFEERTVKTTDGNGGVVEYTVDPSAREWKDTMTAYGIAIDKHLVLVRHDSDDRQLSALDSWLVDHLGVGVPS